ncbi:MAG: ECF transporter S component [Anaerolineae bacterium]|nr:ECF transporter S component [Anaerolineae bacterium]
MQSTTHSPTRGLHLTSRDLAVAGIFGALSIVLAVTPLGMIPVPNMSAAATTLHIPAIIAAIISGPIVGAMVGLILAFTSWYYYSALFLQFMGGNLLFALIDAFLPRILIGVLAYYAFRPFRQRLAVASGVAALVGTLTNSIGVLGLLLLLGTADAVTMIPVILTNVPFEIILSIVITIPVVAALRAAWGTKIAGTRD